MFLVEIFRRVKPFLWLVPGFLLYAAYPPMAERMDVLFALAPLMWLSRRSAAKLSAKRWFFAGFVFWFATLSWMPAIVKNGGPWPLVVLGWFGLAAYCSLYFGLYGYLSATYWNWVRNSSGQISNFRFQTAESPQSSNPTIQPSNKYLLRLLGVLIVEPVLWCGLELIRSRFLGGFAWNQLGVVPANSGFGAPAAFGGVYLLSAAVILINGTIAGIVERVWKPDESGFPKLRRWGSLETILAFLLVFGIYSLPSALPPSHSSTTSPLKVALVQRNFPCVFQAREENPFEVYEKLVENPAALEPDLVVLPESAMCEFGEVSRPTSVSFAKWLSEKCHGAAVLAGGTRVGSDRKLFNSAALYEFENHEPRITTYDKVHLVPFGEFIPGDKWFPILQKLAPVGSCTPGEEKLLSLSARIQQSNNPTIQQSNHSLGIAICFEDTDSALMRHYAAMGAEVLVFITNDSWFSYSVESEQHAWQSVLRAIETGLTVVRVGNSGVTGTIAPDGRCSWLSGPDGRPLVDRRGAMFDRIQVEKIGGGGQRTFYVLLGDWPLGVAFALLMLGYVLIYYKTIYEKRRYLSL